MNTSIAGSRAYPYKVITAPVKAAVQLAALKSHLRLTSCAQDIVLEMYLQAAIDFAEEYTGLDLITRTYETFRDFFPAGCVNSEGYYSDGFMPSWANVLTGNTGFEIRRGPFQTVETFEYLDAVDAVTWVPLDPITFYNTAPQAGQFAEILVTPDNSWPVERVAPRLNSIRITFTSGFGDKDTDVPASLRIGILQHAAALFANRGDCSCDCAQLLPATSKAAYSLARVRNL